MPTPEDDLTWPRKEPENWRSADLTRASARKLFDLVADGADVEENDEFLAFNNQLDEAQGDSVDGVAYLLIRITDTGI